MSYRALVKGLGVSGKLLILLDHLEESVCSLFIMKKLLNYVSKLIVLIISSFVIVKLGKDLLFSLDNGAMNLSEVLLSVGGLALWVWVFALGIRYFYFRFKGKTDEEIYPAKRIVPGTIELKEGMIEFGGSVKYNSIPMDFIEDISYQPRANDYQEVKITKKGEGTYIYHLLNTEEYLNEEVTRINKVLEVEAGTLQT